MTPLSRRPHAARTGGALARAALVLGLLAASPPAAAQTATALDRFDAAPAGDDFVSVPSAAVPGDLALAAGFALSFARSPLILAERTEYGRNELGEVVEHQLVLHNLVSLELFRLLKAEVDVPITLDQDGDSPVSHGVQSVSPSGAAMNDVRGGLRLQLLAPDGWRPAAALALSAWFPSGDSAAYTSTGVTRFAPTLVLGTSRDELAWSVTVGRRFESQPDEAVTLRGSEIVFGAAVAPRIGPVQLGAELFASTVADRGVEAFSADTTSVEALLAAQYQLGPVSFRLAGGPGLTAGVGTPRYRLIASVMYAAELGDETASDDEGPPEDGLPDSTGSAAPGRGGPSASAADDRPQDRDGDGVIDSEDGCPEVVGDPTAEGPRRGCPPDRDGDGVADGDDACPAVPGVRSADPRRDGCPPDGDGDGIVDGEDACPRERGERTTDPKTHGCPKLVRVVGKQIVVLQKIFFKTARSEIEPGSEEVLRQVAQVLADHPEIARVAVDGHTDDQGNEQANIALSQRRALAVVRWLNEHGVDARRTEARGFGPRRPIGDNATEFGRAKNRRVEFQILLRTKDGKAGWRDGPVR